MTAWAALWATYEAANRRAARAFLDSTCRHCGDLLIRSSRYGTQWQHITRCDGCGFVRPRTQSLAKP